MWPEVVMQTATFYRAVMGASSGRSREEAKRVTAAVFHALRDRLTPQEADQLAAQLPGELKEVWQAGERTERKPVKLHRQAFYQRVMKEAGLSSTRQARWMTLAVFGALKESLSPGEAEDVLAQLPKDLKELWAEGQVSA
jgi:uncharacterized protein (DUF2267 family)